MTWTHLPLGNKTSRFTQSALALMIAGTLPAYAGSVPALSGGCAGY